MIAGSVTLRWFLDVSCGVAGVRKIHCFRRFLLCETSASSVSLWFVLLKLTTETQRTQRFHREARLDTLNTGLLKYAVFFCAKFESVYIQKELF
jgi:hypothetical protein